MTEKELIDKSKLEGKVQLLQYLIRIADISIKTNTPTSELWRALLSEQLYSCEKELGIK